MRAFSVAIVFLLVLSFSACKSLDGYTQASFFVRGNCGMCEDRIEETIGGLEGVKKVEWDKTTKTATVWYDSTKVDPMAMEKAVADAGHETENFSSPRDVYDALPVCCKKFEDQ